MAEINVNGRMLVKNFKKQFQEAFGCSLRVYAGRHFADENQTLASLREEGKKGGELSVKGNMLVGNFEAKMLEEYGITVQVANIDDTKLVDNSLTLAAAGRGEERKAVKKTEKVTSAKPEADTPKTTNDEQLQAAQPAEGDKKQFKVVLTGKAICNVPVSSHEDCNETTLDCYDAREIWSDLYGANPLVYCGIEDGAIYDGGAMSLNVKHVQITEELPASVEYNSDATFKIGECDSIEKPYTDEGYAAILECNITCTLSVELVDASDFDLNKLNFPYEGDDSYDGKTINTDFDLEVTKLIGYTDGIKKYEHSYEAPVPLIELVNKYQGAVLELSLLVERENGEFASDEAEDTFEHNRWRYAIQGHQLVNQWTGVGVDIKELDEPCLKKQLPDRLSDNFELDFWGNRERGYDIEALVFSTNEDGDYIDMVCRCILMESWS